MFLDSSDALSLSVLWSRSSANSKLCRTVSFLSRCHTTMPVPRIPPPLVGGPQEGRAGVARRVWAKGTKVPNGMREGGGGDPGRRCGDPDETGRTDTETSREGGTGAFTSLSRVKWKLQLWGNTWVWTGREPRWKVPGRCGDVLRLPLLRGVPQGVRGQASQGRLSGLQEKTPPKVAEGPWPRTAGPNRLQLVADAPGSLALEARGEPGSPGFKSLTTENRCLHL